MSENLKINGKTYNITQVPKNGIYADDSIKKNKIQQSLFDSLESVKKDGTLDSKELSLAMRNLDNLDVDKDGEVTDAEFDALVRNYNKDKAQGEQVKLADVKKFFGWVLDSCQKADEKVAVEKDEKQDTASATAAKWSSTEEMVCHDDSGNTLDIQGKLTVVDKEVKAGENPKKFTITDTSSGSAHVYTYEYLGKDEKTGKPLYKCVSMNDRVAITDNAYTLEVDDNGTPRLVQYNDQNNYGTGLKFGEAQAVEETKKPEDTDNVEDPEQAQEPEKSQEKGSIPIEELDKMAKEAGYRKTWGEGIYYDEKNKVHMRYNEKSGKFIADPYLKFVAKDGKQRYEIPNEDGSKNCEIYDKDGKLVSMHARNYQNKVYLKRDFVAKKLGLEHYPDANENIYYDKESDTILVWNEKEHSFIVLHSIVKPKEAEEAGE